VDAAFLGVHTGLGPGLLESVDKVLRAYDLRTVRQQTVPVVYHGTRIEMDSGQTESSRPRRLWRSNLSRRLHPSTRSTR
jgi:hypothetical protein